LIALVSINSYTAMLAAQILIDSVCAVIIFLIGDELLAFSVGLVAGVLAALSPHLAYYALWLTPDSMVALPTLLALWLLIRGIKSRHLMPFVVAGCFIGLACWLRSNSLLLAPMLSVMVWQMIGERRVARTSAAAITAAALLTIAPLTIRNYVISRRLIPTSIQHGLNLVEGIADYDPAGKFGMPPDDIHAAIKDSEWYGRPDYARNLWAPDGISRDEERFRRGLAVVTSHPLWFLSVMGRRAGFMLRYNDTFGSGDWPLNTARVPLVQPEPGFGHYPGEMAEARPIASMSAAGLASSGEVRSNEALVAFSPASNMLSVTGSGKPYDPEFSSAPIPVQPETDYLLNVRAKLESGTVAVKVMDAGLRSTIAILRVPLTDELRALLARKERNGALTAAEPATLDQESDDDVVILHIPFCSGPHRSVRVALVNGSPDVAHLVIDLGQIDLYEYGPTTFQWTRYPRAVIYVLQKDLFLTTVMLPLVILGALLLGILGDRRALVMLAAVPVYYLVVQSALHTEYRYILPMHYFLFVFAAITLCVGSSLISAGAALVWNKVRGPVQVGYETQGEAP
ncbi:MAG TPA: glycosyltransferase family 39 protein, partial [Blastocatellia bacterium]